MDQSQIHEAPRREVLKAVRPGPTESPPPNCAICLGTCTNKCFTDCCLHQFCFTCLLEWSKIKAECPLCKQPFKSIIYNIKSNSEYEEHVIPNPEREISEEELQQDDPQNEYLFLPNVSRQRHYQFRTTLTVNPGGELAIQQLLLAHPLTQSIFFPVGRHFRVPPPVQTIQFRRSVYTHGWWVTAPPDSTGQYRECSPHFYRVNPAQTDRIIPWLNRELSALILDYLDIFVLQETILEMLCQHHVCSSAFRSRVYSFLGPRTDHFIHEFYTFLRSPFDMIGYDRHARYRNVHPLTAAPFMQLSDDDSDVRVVDSPNDCIYVPPRTPEVIVIDSDSDSDVIIREPTPPPLVDLVNTTDTDEDDALAEPDERRKSPQLPLKLRLKIGRGGPHRPKKNHITKRRNSTDSLYMGRRETESESSSATNSDEYSCDCVPIKTEGKYTQPLILKRIKPKQKSYAHKYKSEALKRSSDESDSDSSHRHRSKRNTKTKKYKRKTSDSERRKRKRFKSVKTETNVPKYKISKYTNSDSDTDYDSNKSAPIDVETTSNRDRSESPRRCSSQDLDVAGPSCASNHQSVIQNVGNKWYNRPDLKEHVSDASD